MSTPTLAQLQQAITLAEKIEQLQAELAGLVGDGASVAPAPKVTSTPVAKKGKRRISAAHRAKLAAAAKARWAKAKGTSAPAAKVAKPAKKKAGK